MIRTAKYNYLLSYVLAVLTTKHVRPYNMCLEYTAAGFAGFLHALSVILTYSGILHTFQYNSHCSACTLQKASPQNNRLNSVCRRRIQRIIFMMALCLKKNRSHLTGTDLLHLFESLLISCHLKIFCSWT